MSEAQDGLLKLNQQLRWTVFIHENRQKTALAENTLPLPLAEEEAGKSELCATQGAVARL